MVSFRCSLLAAILILAVDELVGAEVKRSHFHSHPPEVNCLARCVVGCLAAGNGTVTEGGGGVNKCQERCQPYSSRRLCEPPPQGIECWRRCKDLGAGPPHRPPEEEIPSVVKVKASYGVDGRINVHWEAVNNASLNAPSLYLIQYRPVSELPWHEVFSAERTFTGLELANSSQICEDIQIRVSALNGLVGIEGFSAPEVLDEAQPPINPRMQLKSIVYEQSPFTADGYHDPNGTLTVTLEYTLRGQWPLGDDDDLVVEPLFHMLTCAEPDLAQAVPVPEFHKSASSPHAVEARFGADMMYRRCRFIYVVHQVKSRRCGLTYPITSSNDDYSSVEINCDNVVNSRCNRHVQHAPPQCGQIDEFHYELVNASGVDWADPQAALTVNASFVPRERRTKVPLKPLYYVALWGDATHYAQSAANSVFGVNMTSVLGTVSNCDELATDGSCKRLVPALNSILLPNLTMDHLYGVMLCAVVDPQNLTLPSVDASEKFMRVKSHPVLISSTDYAHFTPTLFGSQHRRWLWPATILLVLLVALAAGALGFWLWRRRSVRKGSEKDKSSTGSLPPGRKRETNERYADFPRRVDQWELERRQLVIHDDKKLGSGAFGAVYLGRLLGSAKASRDGQSTLGVNLMRAENCEVAVKMLPEYADELSKSEFLREIGLMKTLGYHERLVNMLACITTSEPLCLVVEYCSDGDLLHFLRGRCDYMLGLNERNIDYADPDVNEEGELVDFTMIMTLRQLLQFAVQISYGLEYLSQRGFVHRDIAARNILVHDKAYAKIGDFGLCRYIYAQEGNYKSRGGRLPIKWMAPESIRHYDFTTHSDVWSFGVLMFEIITLGGTPYPGVQPDDMLELLESGRRLTQPDNCPDAFYKVMESCWVEEPTKRADCSSIRKHLAMQLEEISDDEYAYLKLDSQRDYYRAARTVTTTGGSLGNGL